MIVDYLNKNQNAPRPSEHPPVRGETNVKTFRWDQRLQIQNLFMASNSKRVPLWWYHWANSIISGRSPPLYCTLTLIAMQGHQKNSKDKTVVVVCDIIKQ